MSGARPRVLCAPDKLRGALDAAGAARALAEGVRAGGGEALELPIADGGEGTLDAFAADAELLSVSVRDALGRPRSARLGDLGEGTFLVEAAEAVGLGQVAVGERDVARASSFGVGKLLRTALDHGARRVLVALGGTATLDGGAGLLAALGARCRANGAGLCADPSADLSRLDPRLRAVELEVLADVRAPLTGPEGAAARFGPQKGATAEQVVAFDAALGRWAEALGVDPQTLGAGAGGGLGAALIALGARVRSGAEAVLDLKNFNNALAGADLCLLAEGRIDASTLQGKAVAAAVARCAALGVPAVVLGGAVDEAAAAELRARGARAVRPLGPADRPLTLALAATATDLAHAAQAATTQVP